MPVLSNVEATRPPPKKIARVHSRDMREKRGKKIDTDLEPRFRENVFHSTGGRAAQSSTTGEITGGKTGGKSSFSLDRCPRGSVFHRLQGRARVRSSVAAKEARPGLRGSRERV